MSLILTLLACISDTNLNKIDPDFSDSTVSGRTDETTGDSNDTAGDSGANGDTGVPSASSVRSGTAITTCLNAITTDFCNVQAVASDSSQIETETDLCRTRVSEFESNLQAQALSTAQAEASVTDVYELMGGTISVTGIARVLQYQPDENSWQRFQSLDLVFGDKRLELSDWLEDNRETFEEGQILSSPLQQAHGHCWSLETEESNSSPTESVYAMESSYFDSEGQMDLMLQAVNPSYDYPDDSETVDFDETTYNYLSLFGDNHENTIETWHGNLDNVSGSANAIHSAQISIRNMILDATGIGADEVVDTSIVVYFEANTE